MPTVYRCPYCKESSEKQWKDRELFKSHLLEEHRSEIEVYAKRYKQSLNWAAGMVIAFLCSKEA